MTLPLQALDPADSPLGRLDPRWKLLGLAGLALSVATLRSPAILLAALAAGLALIRLGRLRRGWVLPRVGALLLTVLPFALLLPLTLERGATWLQWGPWRLTEGAAEAAAALLLRSLTLLLLAMVLLATSPFHRTLHAAQALGCPRLLVQLANLTYRYLFLLAEEFARLRTALRVRGFRNRATRHGYRTVGNVIGTLLVRGNDQAERVAHAMRCRGYDGTLRSRERLRTRGVDLLACGLLWLLAAALAWWQWG